MTPDTLWKTFIYNELLRLEYSVDVGVVTDRTGGANVQKEIDFVVNDVDKKTTSSLPFIWMQKKESSELASLMLTKDFLKKSLSAWIFLTTSMMTTEFSIAI